MLLLTPELFLSDCYSVRCLINLTFFLFLKCAFAASGSYSGSGSSPRRGHDDLHAKWDHEWAFTGISTFAHRKHVKCLSEPDVPFDIGIIGAPFDTAVSYRPGARFGPKAIRAASARQVPFRGYSPSRQIDPYNSPFTIIDCGDIPISPFDNALALEQMTAAYVELGSRAATMTKLKDARPKLISLGGDHSIILGALRALRKIHKQPIAVIHFDAHQDTWNPTMYPSSWPSEQAEFTHGTMLWMASREGLINNGSSVHGGLRSLLSGPGDYDVDDQQGFARISAEDIDELGTQGIIDQIVARVGTELPVYLSVDIDVIDPGLCPGTGTPEVGGWTSRELIRILRGLKHLNIVGADIVEVAPAYDGPGEQTALAAAQIVYEIVANMVDKGLKDLRQSVDQRQREEL